MSGDTSAASQHKASPLHSRRPLGNEVEATTVVSVDLPRCSACKPLLRHDPTLRANSLATDLYRHPFHDESGPGQQGRGKGSRHFIAKCMKSDRTGNGGGREQAELRLEAIRTRVRLAQKRERTCPRSPVSGRRCLPGCQEASKARRQKSDLASSIPGIGPSKHWPRLHHRRARARVWQDVCKGDVSEQVLHTRRREESDEEPGVRCRLTSCPRLLRPWLLFQPRQRCCMLCTFRDGDDVQVI